MRARAPERLEKLVFSTSARIVDVHRPAQQYIDLFDRYCFAIPAVAETPGVDLETFDRTSDFMIFQLRRVIGKEVAPHASL